VRVGPGGDTDVDFDLGAPCQLEVRFVDRETLWPIERGEVGWSRRSDRGEPVPMTGEIEGGTLRIRAVPGEITVAANFPGYRYHPATVHAVPGTHQHEITLVRSCGIRLRLLEDGASIRLALVPLGLRVIPESGTGRLERYTYLTPVHLFLTEPGTYRLEFPELEGYAPVPPRSVFVPYGETIEVDVPVVPER